jgi:large subunit ribosomal protein L4
MTTLTVYNKSGGKVGSIDVDPAQIAPRINKQLLHDAVVMYECNLRMGTQQTKTRSQTAGTTKKMYRQKGTGNARAGSRRSGIRRGGGHMKAISTRDWTYRLPRKALQAATRMALAAKIRDEQVVVIDELKFAAPKTSEMAGVLGALNIGKTSVLVTTAAHDANVYKSARNIPRVTVAPVADLNAYYVLKPQRMLVTKSALESLTQPKRGADGENGTGENGTQKKRKPTTAKPKASKPKAAAKSAAAKQPKASKPKASKPAKKS